MKPHGKVIFRWNKVLIIPIVIIGLLVWLLWPRGEAEANWYNESWQLRTPLTVDGTGSASSNKRVKFDIDTATLITNNKMQSDCGDSRFTDSTGTLLEYYIDSGAGACNTASTDYWVLIPGTVSVEPFTIYHYYDNGVATNGTVAAQFSQSEFAGYTTSSGTETKSPGPVVFWKMDEGTDNTCTDGTNDVCDGTNAQNDLAKSGASWRNGELCFDNGCLQFDGSDDYLTMSDDNDLDFAANDSFTISGWFKHDQVTADPEVLIVKQQAPLGIGSTATTTITTSTSEGLGQGVGSWSHRVEYDPNNDRWHVLYIDTDGTDLHTRSSAATSGTSWTDGTDINVSVASVDYEDFSCVTETDASTTYMHCVMSASDTDLLYYRRCTLTGTTPFISCDAEQTVYNSADNNDDVTLPRIAVDSNDCVLIVADVEDDSIATASDEHQIYLWKEAATCGDGTWGTAAGYPFTDLDTTSPGYTSDAPVGIEIFDGSDAQIYMVNDDTATAVILNTVYFDGTAMGTVRVLDADVEFNTNRFSAWSVISDQKNTTFSLDDGTTDLDGWNITTKNAALGSQVDTLLNMSGTVASSPQLATAIVDTNASGADDIWLFAANNTDQTDLYYNTSTGFGTSWPAGTLWVNSFDTTEVKFLSAAYNSENCDAMVSWLGNSASPFNVNSKIINTGSCTGSSAGAGYNIKLETDGNIYFNITDDTLTNEQLISTSGDYDDGKWHNISAVKDGTSSMILYIDGKKVAENTSISATGSLENTTALYIGTDYDGLANDFDGFLDNFKVYRYARTEAQIKSDLIPGATKKGSSAVVGSRTNAFMSNNLVGFWKMDESAANSCTGGSNDSCDSSGNGNDSAWSGSVTSTNGKFGGGTIFDGNNDVITTSNSVSLSPTSDITVSGWVRMDSAFSNTSDYNVGLFDKGDYQFYLDKSDGKAKWVVNDATAAAFSALSTGSTNTVNALAVWNGNLYIAGNFTNVGDANGDGVVMWNGSSFSSLSTGITGTSVNALAAWNGKLYIGGQFSDVGDANGDNIVAWNGSAFSSLSTGISSTRVLTLAPWNGKIYIGGTFTNVGDANGDNIVAWNGSAFSSLSTGIAATRVQALAVWDSNLYIGGTFTNIGDANGDNIVAWNGSAFSSLSTGINSTVSGLGVWNGNLYVVGLFIDAGDTNGDYVTKWNGSAFSSLSTGMTNNTFALAAWNGDLYIAGNFTDVGSSSGDYIVKWGTSATKIVSSTTSSWSANTWYHVAATYNASEMKMYVNGVLESTATGVPASLGSQSLLLYFGKSHGSQMAGGSEEGLTGRLDDIRIYNRALELSEVENIYNWIPGPIGFWKLDENRGISTVNDSSTLENSLIMNAVESTDWVPGRFGSALNINSAGGSAAGSNETANKIDDAGNPGTLGGRGRSIVRTSAGTRYAFINDTGSCEMWKSSNGSSWTQQGAGQTCDSQGVGANFISSAIDGNGIIHLAYLSGTSLKYNTFNTGTDSFVGEANVFTTSNDDVLAPAIAVDSNNIPHIAFLEATTGFIDAAVRYTNRVGGSWDGTPVTVEASTSNTSYTDGVSIMIDSNNIPELAYIQHSASDLTAGLGNANDATSFTLTDVDISVNIVAGETGADIAQDSSGNTWIAYLDENGASDLITLVKHNSGDAWGTWQTPTNSATVGDDVSIYIRGTTVYVIYEDGPADIAYDIYTGSWAGTATLHTGTYGVVHSRWSNYFNYTTNQLDYLYYESSSTDVYWASLGLGASNDTDSLSRADDADFDFAASQDFTVSSWVKLDGTAAAINYILTKADTTTGGYKLYMDPSGDFCFVTDDDSSWDTSDSACTSAIDYDDGKWHYVSGVKTGITQIDLYVDGILVATDSSLDDTSTLANGNALYIGVDRDGTSNLWTGSVDEIKIYNYARSSAQIVEDMNGGHPVGGSPIGSQAGWWKFDDGSGTTAQDSGPNNNDLTLSAARWTTSGKFGKAWDGSAAYVSRADDNDFDFAAADDFSVTFWFKSDSTSNESVAAYLVSKGTIDVSGTAGYTIYSSAGAGDIRFAIDDDGFWGANAPNVLNPPDDTTGSTSDYYDGNWHHVVARKTGTSRIDLFVDGKLASSDTSISATGTLANSAALYVGNDDTDAANSANVNIDELKIYRAALTNSQILVDYNRGRATIMGSTSTTSDGITADNSSDREYCIPGDTSTCSGPVGEWKFDENTGTAINDTSTNGHNLTTSSCGTPVWIPGKFGSAMMFDGTDDCVDENDVNMPNLVITGNVSLSAWVYRRRINTDDYIIHKDGDGAGSGANKNYQLYLNDTDNILRMAWSYGSDVTHTVNSTAAVDGTNQWIYLSATRDTSTRTVNFYMNGSPLGIGVTYPSANDPTDGTGTPGDFNIGSATNAGSNDFFDGYLDNARVYNYVRTPAQIAWEYNRGAPVAWYKLDECTGLTTYNSMKNSNGAAAGNNGTISLGSSGVTSTGTCSTSGAWANGANGKFNSSISLDGSDDYISITDPSTGILDFGANQDFSISVWIKSTTNGLLLRKQNGSAAGYRLNLHSVNDDLEFYISDGSEYNCDTNTDVTNGNWNHILALRNGSSMKVYINGSQKCTTSGTSATLANAENFIVAQSAGGTYLNAQIDDIRVYRYSLTALQIQTLYNENAAVRFGPITGAP